MYILVALANISTTTICLAYYINQRKVHLLALKYNETLMLLCICYVLCKVALKASLHVVYFPIMTNSVGNWDSRIP